MKLRDITKIFRIFVFVGMVFLSPIVGGDQLEVRELVVDDMIINPVAAEYIIENIDKAEKDDVGLLIIKLDTPGGLLSSTRTIVKRMMNADVPIVVYVAPDGSRAGSAGVFITLASHVAAMAPSTNIGAAHPVEMGGGGDKSIGKTIKKIKKKLSKGDEEGNGKDEEVIEEEISEDPMSDKIMNDTLAWVESIAEARGRNVRWAKDSVSRSDSIGAEEALKRNVINVIAKDETELLAKIDGRKVRLPSGTVVLRTKGAELKVVAMTFRQRFLNVIINPNIAYILMMLGFYGLLFEFTHPGAGFPGVAGAICIILAFYAFHTIPTNYAGLALIILSIILFIAEVKVVSYGLLTLGGLVTLFLGSLFLFDSGGEFMRVSLSVIIPVVAATAAIFIFLVSLAAKAQRSKKVSGVEGLIGEVGVIDDAGKVFVHGEIWDAVGDGVLAKGDRVEVIAVKGMKLMVKRL